MPPEHPGRPGERPAEGGAGHDAEREAERDAIIAALRPVADGIVATLGPFCEAVVHDFRRPERSVVALAGSVTGRAVGGSMSEIGMGVLARGDAAQDELNYLTRTASGTMVKSSTMVLRDSAGSVFGAFCVNLDITPLERAGALIGRLAGGEAPAELPTTTFGNDIEAVLDAIVDAHRLREEPWSGLDRDARLGLFNRLDEAGVFAVRGAVQRVADRLGMSRASAYSYLAQARDARTAAAPDATGRRHTTSDGEQP